MTNRCAASLLAFFGSSFAMHFAWESAQMPLFKSADTSVFESIRMCLFATATGDMLFMLTIYLTVAVIHRNGCWLLDRTAYLHPATWLIPVLVGVLLAACFELWAIHAVHRWEYAQSMPLIPFVHVGITPILQMIVIPPATMAVCRFLANRAHSAPLTD